MIELPAGIALPLWFICILLLLSALKPYIPFLTMIGGKKNYEQRIKDLEEELAVVKEELRVAVMKHEEMREREARMKGLIHGFSVYLKQNGFADFPDIDQIK